MEPTSSGHVPVSIGENSVLNRGDGTPSSRGVRTLGRMGVISRQGIISHDHLINLGRGYQLNPFSFEPVRVEITSFITVPTSSYNREHHGAVIGGILIRASIVTVVLTT